jgi:hypothetical protein
MHASLASLTHAGLQEASTSQTRVRCLLKGKHQTPRWGRRIGTLPTQPAAGIRRGIVCAGLRGPSKTAPRLRVRFNLYFEEAPRCNQVDT